MEKKTGRTRQKLRTHRDLLEGARRLLVQGKVPTVARAAEEAGISRATAYRFFPRQDSLLLEALLSVTVQHIKDILESPSYPKDPEQRLHILFVEIYKVLERDELAFRAFLRFTLEESEEPRAVHRGGRRALWIDTALEPAFSLMTPARYQALRIQLSVLLGIEPLIVYRDVLGLTSKQAAASAWETAKTLLRASLAEAGTKSPEKTATSAKQRRRSLS